MAFSSHRPRGTAASAQAPAAPPAGPAWTASYLAFVTPLDAEAVFRPGGADGGASAESRLDYRWISLARRLVWRHGVEEALRRLNAAPDRLAVDDDRERLDHPCRPGAEPRAGLAVPPA